MALPPAPRTGADDDLTARAKAWVERSCMDQGLPVKLTDPRVLAEIAELLGGPQVRQTGRRRVSSKRLKPRRPGSTST